MLIYNCHGYELVKAQPNTSEDFFNRSEVEYEYNGQKIVTSVLYVRFFEEKLSEFSALETTRLFENENLSVDFCDIVALALIIKNPDYRGRKRIYINELDQFSKELQGVDFDKVVGYAKSMKQNSNKIEISI
ncbi:MULTISPECIES: hypothetical protein [unclassified Bacillus (in: firmicutes)]|uniref:hypothetical protein n=1 Tax=unclassified Bacillus (in: firmicutes) TaxID=185979 RepID=UPI000BF00B3B|nr:MULTISPECIES: hypothetical protein [unclassified Bacillus (in: firmicutes)]PEJ53716.1 hypothetical protein CN692_20615 [Bacillus sp. AFS002410]PEL11624.1 hypothetical protein CN601_09440 [Bacillus sp. AFS017336]